MDVQISPSSLKRPSVMNWQSLKPDNLARSLPRGTIVTMPARPLGFDAIIVNYNAGEILRDAVLSLLSQVGKGRIFVVDNASTDCSLDGLTELVASGDSVTIIRNANNLGFATACNQPLPECRNEFILFLNPDCIVGEGATESLLTLLSKDLHIAVAGPKLVNPDGSEQPGGRRAIPTPWRSCVRVFNLSSLESRYPRLFSDFYLHKQPLPDHPVEVEAISGACMMVRRSALAEVGGLDENYFMHCEDLDWCMRFRQKGWKIMFVPEAKVVHEKGICSKHRPYFVEWHKHKGMMRFYRKFFRHQYPGGMMWLVGMGIWARFAAVGSRHLYMKLKGAIKHRSS